MHARLKTGTWLSLAPTLAARADKWRATVEFTVTQTIAAPREQVLEVLVDPGYYRYLGAQSTTVQAPELLSASDEGGTISTRVRYAFNGTLSGPAALVVDVDKLTWVIETNFDPMTHTGTLVVVPDHYEGMLRCHGTLTLHAGDGAGDGDGDGDGAGDGDDDEHEDGVTVETVSGRLEVRVPLVSRSAEQAIFGGFRRHLEVEAAAMADYCSRVR